MDVLSEVLRAVRLNGAVFFDIYASQPWAVASPPMAEVRSALMPGAEHVIPFHMVMSGTGWLESADGSLPPVRLEPGDVVLCPRGHGHRLASYEGCSAQPDMCLYYRPTDQQLPFVLSEIGGGGEPARLVCGYFGCDSTPFNPLLDALPAVTVVKGGPDCGRLAGTFIKAALAEGDQQRPGGETILAKLSELMLVQALRMYIDALPDAAEGWLSGLRDPQISKVLGLIHGRPDHDWTLATLARETGQSRSALAERFMRFVKQPPMQYLARWRMQLAAHELEGPNASIADIAGRVGYQSEAAFNRAFKKHVGTPPGLWRKSHGMAA